MQIVSRQPSSVEPARIAPLSVLPVFFDLAGKDVIVCGGSDAAAWKAELLVAAGARVRLFAPHEEVESQMLRLITREAGSARLDHHSRRWAPADFEGAALSISDALEGGEAKTFANAARRAGVPYNVIDKPEFSGFQFGSIVNRSPVVVGISTSGAAPILGQAVRQRIETLLPPSLAAWARLAQRIRGLVVSTFAPGQARRAIWEALVDRAFGSPPAADDDDRSTFETLAADIRGFKAKTGKVTFVGAGPGDPEHLTLKAVRALQAADVILFDDLVSDGVLELARREARRILVGKRAGRPSCRQAEINDMMIRLAKAGRHVVRLKSGDPMIFGRGGEEIERLQAENIAYAVVPGVTAGMALAAAAGVSLTHRDLSRSVRFVTGHSKKGGLPDDLDFEAIAHPAATTIVYMGGRNSVEIADRLIERGMPPQARVAVGVALGRPNQAVVFSLLCDLARDVEALGLHNPIVLGIGRVFDEAANAGAAYRNLPQISADRVRARCSRLQS